MEQMNEETSKYEFLLEIITQEAKSTIQVECIFRARYPDCPDNVARMLNKLRKKGKIHGAVSVEKGSFLWWKE